MLLTPEVSHAPMSWLKAEASWNMPSIVVTPEVSHAPMSWSSAEAFEHPSHRRDAGGVPRANVLVEGRRCFVRFVLVCAKQCNGRMSVTPDVSNAEMWPYVSSAASRPRATLQLQF